ncbi:MAG TPA: Ni/Fe hydrogenase subunit alpha, partial [Anaerolineae bacterium]|nr:Ni/Fe hydrogenase subunit alpha [Anaerolineae bacterium]
TDEQGLVTSCNLIVGTTNNIAPMSTSIRQAAQGLITKGGVISEGLLNMVEMAFRAYDPCMSCATHALPGRMPLEVRILNSAGQLIERLSQGID